MLGGRGRPRAALSWPDPRSPHRQSGQPPHGVDRLASTRVRTRSPAQRTRSLAAPPPAPGTFRIGQIAGTDVLVTSSWFLIAALISVVMAPLVESARPGLGGWKYVAGLAFAVVLYLSVLLHEVSHALMAKHYGHPVDSITLHFLGGATAIEGEARNPSEEFLIAVVGPVTSLLLGLGAWLLWLVMPGRPARARASADCSCPTCWSGALNLVPGLPLDGGRVLKAGVWRLTGNPHRGTIAAGWGGRLTAVAVLFWPALMQQATGQQSGAASTTSCRS